MDVTGNIFYHMQKAVPLHSETALLNTYKYIIYTIYITAHEYEISSN